MSHSTLAGSAAVVTGASTGIGRAIALAFASAGADVAITYRSGEREASEVAGEIEALGRRAHVFQLDLADPASIAPFASDAWAALGRVDVWVNNAGADILTGTAENVSDIEKLDRVLTVDLRGTVLASWEAARRMREQPVSSRFLKATALMEKVKATGAAATGAPASSVPDAHAAGGADVAKAGHEEHACRGVIINMSWDHVLSGMAGRNPEIFSAAKGGILSFSKSLARSVAPRVRVNVLAPGWIETEFGSGLDERHRRRVVESTPLRRWGTPEDVARAAVFLASPDASFLTGQTVMVGGGIVM